MVMSYRKSDEINFGGIGRLLALTPNSEVNALSNEHYQNTFGVENVFELQRREIEERDGISVHLGGRTLFPPTTTYDTIINRFQNGADIVTIRVNDVQALQNAIPNAILPLFVIPDKERLLIWTEIESPTLRQGNELIVLIEPEFYDELLEAGAIESSGDLPEKAKENGSK